jgi:hypothetical protein
MPKLTDFINSFADTDLARPKQFDVIIPTPLPLIRFINTNRNLSFRCETTNLPSRSFLTTEQKFGTNPVEKHAYHTTYNDLDMTFIVSDTMEEKKFFDAWMEYINPSITFDFNYRNDYTTTLTLIQYDVSNEISYSINLIDAFPISMNQLDLDWSNDGFHKLAITFAYRYWQTNDLQEIYNNYNNANSTNAGGLGKNYGVLDLFPATPGQKEN